MPNVFFNIITFDFRGDSITEAANSEIKRLVCLVLLVSKLILVLNYN